MDVKRQVMIFISLVILSNMIDLIMCINKRIKIYVPEYIKHVHHHHVKKVPVYIVTKDKPIVMHASDIEDEFDDVPYREIPRIKSHTDYDDGAVIQSIYKVDKSQPYEDIATDFEHTTLEPQPQIEMKNHKLPFILRSQNSRQKNRLQQHAGKQHNMLALYDQH